MICVAEDYFRAELFEFIGGLSFDGSLRANRHENRGANFAMAGFQYATSGKTIGRFNFESEGSYLVFLVKP